MDAGLRSVLAGLAAGRLPWPLYLHGDVGTGKSAGALALLDQFGPVLPGELDATPPALDWLAGYVVAGTLASTRIAADRGRLSWRTPGSGSDELGWGMLSRKVQEGPLVVLDDLGIGPVRDFALETLLELFDPRLASPVRPTVIISNVTPSAIAGLTDARTADRLLAGTVFGLTGASRRRTATPQAAPEPRTAPGTAPELGPGDRPAAGR